MSERSARRKPPAERSALVNIIRYLGLTVKRADLDTGRIRRRLDDNRMLSRRFQSSKPRAGLAYTHNARTRSPRPLGRILRLLEAMYLYLSAAVASTPDEDFFFRHISFPHLVTCRIFYRMCFHC